MMLLVSHILSNFCFYLLDSAFNPYISQHFFCFHCLEARLTHDNNKDTLIGLISITFAWICI